MPDIAPLGPSIGISPVSPMARTSPLAARSDAPREDRVEISDHARHLDRLRSLPDVRASKVEAIRASIADGTYDTPERMKVALQRLLDDLTA